MKSSHFLLLAGGPRPDEQARQFASDLRNGASNMVLAVLADSTSNAYDEHLYIFLRDHLLPAFPAYLGQYQLWSDSASSYDVNTSTFSGVFGPVAGDVLFEDNFNRADGSLGTSSSGGQTWAANAYLISGNKASVPASGTAPLTGADITETVIMIEADITIRSSGSYRIYGLYNTGNGRGVFVDVTASGMTLFGNFGSGNITLAAMSRTFTADQEYHLTLVLAGDFVGAICGDVSCSRFLSGAQQSALTGRRSFFSGPANTGLIDNFRISELANPRRLRIYNASHTGADIAYHDPKIASTIPEEPDLVLIALGHNDSTGSADGYLAAMVTLVTSIRALYPAAPVIVTAENARTDASAAGAAARFSKLRENWSSRGWGFMDVESAFLATGNVASLLQGDGVHPDADGTAVWVAADAVHFGTD